jgi:hypothetical protein
MDKSLLSRFISVFKICLQPYNAACPQLSGIGPYALALGFEGSQGNGWCSPTSLRDFTNQN